MRQQSDKVEESEVIKALERCALHSLAGKHLGCLMQCPSPVNRLLTTPVLTMLHLLLVHLTVLLSTLFVF